MDRRNEIDELLLVLHHCMSPYQLEWYQPSHLYPVCTVKL